MHLALYCFASSQLSTALSLLYRARYLTLLVFGEDHPEMALLDVSAGGGGRPGRREPQSWGSGTELGPPTALRTTSGWCCTE